MANYLPALPDARRVRNFLLRLPLTTRGILVILTLFYIAHFIFPGLEQWGALIPQEININTLYRLNTFPLIHKNFFHFFFNVLALIPLLERFESEHGTVTTFLLFSGPFGLLPGGLYTVLERYIFRLNSGAIGSSVWVFLLLANEAMKMYRQNPYLAIMEYNIPTWTTPLFLIFVITFLIPHTSLIGHLCGAAVGYLWGLGYIRFLAPPDKILRWIEGKLNLLGRLPHYVSVDQKTYGRYGVLPSTRPAGASPVRVNYGSASPAGVLGPTGSTQRLGP